MDRHSKTSMSGMKKQPVIELKKIARLLLLVTIEMHTLSHKTGLDYNL